MSRRSTEPDPTGAGTRLGLTTVASFLPFLVLAAVLLLRVFAPRAAEKAELFWLDLALDFRARVGRSEPLDPSIRFAELSVDEEISRRYADEGEYATVSRILETLARLEVRVVAVDIVYAYGRAEDQRILADTIRRLHETTRTIFVLSTAIEGRGDGVDLLRSLPQAGGEDLRQGVVNVPAASHWREYQLVHRFSDETMPSLALAAFAASRPAALAPKVTGAGKMEWRVTGPGGKAVSRQGDEARLFLNLRHSYFDDRYDRTLPELSEGGRVWKIDQLERLAERTGGASPLRDTIVFLGYDAEVDGKATTHGVQEPGMLLHATALHDLMHGTAIRPAPAPIDVGFHLLVASIAALVFVRIRSKRWLVIIAAIGILAILATGWIAVWSQSLLLLPASVLSAVLWGGAFILEVGRRWTVEQRERTRRDAMLGFYFSPSVLKQVTRNLDMIRPRGREVAVLLSDLRDFTTLCESGEVERVFELLNRLFAIETEAALREDGSLARFAGDQFLAYWGAPEACEDAPDRALRAALEIQETLRRRVGSPDADEIDQWMRIGIGLHRGRGLVGHLGSRSYRDYSIVGDCVNTTARIESQTKNYAAAILASGEFMAALKVKPLSLLVDRVRVKGKSRSTELHAIFARDEDPGEEGRETYGDAFARYEVGDFAGAADLFFKLKKSSHATLATSAGVLEGRCRGYLESPPASWDGVHELSSK